jgi:site-specific DNA-methyltransferase (adenine-specific)
MTPYYADDTVTLFHGDMREVIPVLGLQADLVVADPPYGCTPLPWDRWPDGWPGVLAATGFRSLWCFGSMRMFLDRRDEFAAWQLSQDIVWEKANGTSFASDRFKRVHEVATHWYRGAWRDVCHQTPRVPAGAGADIHHRRLSPHEKRARHLGATAGFTYVDDGTRLTRSILRHQSVRGGHPTEKPIALLDSLIRYACPPGGTVLDPFAGSGSTAEAARFSGRRAVLIEADERYCEAIAQRMSQAPLPLAPPSEEEITNS